MKPAARPHSFYLQVIVILVALAVLRLWMTPVEVLPRAGAQGLPDSGAQRQHLIQEARRTNEILARIEAQLTKGVLSVRTLDAEPAKSRRGSGKSAKH